MNHFISELKVPTTGDGAVLILYYDLDKDDREVILLTKPEDYHHCIGRKIRTTWGLWLKGSEQTELSRWFGDILGLGHADDMSAIILAWLFATVRFQFYDVAKEARKLKSYWYQQGINPLTMKDLQPK